MSKKFLFAAAAAVLALVSCTEEEKPQIPEVPEVKDAIELSASSTTFEKDGGNYSVQVTSTGDWTLTSAEEYTWVTPSVFEGKDGDVVKFTAIKNMEENRQGVFTFTCGTATADFTVTSIAGEKPTFTLNSNTDFKFEFEAGSFTIKANCSLGYQAIKATLSEGADAWITMSPVIQGVSEKDGEITVNYKKLDALEDRAATITLNAEGVEGTTYTINIEQIAKLVLAVDNEAYAIDIAGGDLIVPVTTNVDYNVTIANGDGWLTLVSNDRTNVKLQASKLESGKRSATVTLTQKITPSDSDAIAVSFVVNQSNVIISWAADMNHNRLFPKLETVNMGYAESTLEAWVYVNEFKSGTSGNISVLMGVETSKYPEFIVRFGDEGVEGNVLQIAGPEGKIKVNYNFLPKTWYHIAVTYNGSEGQTLKVYVNGNFIQEGQLTLSELPLRRPWSYDAKWVRPGDGRIFDMACWHYGYSWDQNRTLNGMMTELRMWNVIRTPEEIKANMYQVDPASEGLLSYWKFTEGKGDVIKDKSTSSVKAGTDLYGDMDLKKGSDDVVRGTEGIKWVPIALPIE